MNHISKLVITVLLSLCVLVTAGMLCVAEPEDTESSEIQSTHESSSETSSENDSSVDVSSEEDTSDESSHTSSSHSSLVSSSRSETSSRTATSYYETSAAAPDETEEKENNDRYTGKTSTASSKGTQSRVKKNNKNSSEAESTESQEEAPAPKNVARFANVARILFFVPLLIGIACIVIMIRFNVLASKAKKARAKRRPHPSASSPDDKGEVSLESFATGKKKSPRNGKHYK